jgi:exopolysaccharide production protein ExoQ
MLFTPPPSSLNQLARAAAVDDTDTPGGFWFEYSMCCFSFTSLLLNDLLATVAIIGFLLPWFLIAVLRLRSCVAGIRAHYALLFFPMYALLSTLWSDDRLWTMKASLEFLVTVLVGICAGSVIKPRILLDSLLTSLGVIVAMSVSMIRSTDIHFSGLFGSKNEFAHVISLLLITSMSILVCRNQNRLFRFAALGCLLGSVPVLYLAGSVGALLAAVFTFVGFCGTLVLKRMRSSVRGLMLPVFLLGLLLFAFVVAAMDITMADVLTTLGKDSTLTGRTYLWQKAVDFIGERPLFGCGYNAFWRLDNSEAQDLLYVMHVPRGSGFNFHNEYLHIFVDLGVGGFLLFVGYLVIAGKKAYRSIFTPRLPDQPFALMLYLYALPRTPVEVSIFSHFSLAMVVFCVMWIYLDPPAPAAAPLSVVKPLLRPAHAGTTSVKQ